LPILEVPVDDEIGIEPAGEKVQHILHGRYRHPFSGLLREDAASSPISPVLTASWTALCPGSYWRRA
jgi:hypothetical protein